MTFPLERYLQRINLRDVPAGLAGLVALQEAHMRAIPFENIDPLLGTVPSLQPDKLVAKLIEGERGGYCYEHNAIFGWALEALGYEPQTLLCRVRNGANEGGARSHQAFIVEAGDEMWLCDTGFGGHGSLHPLRITDPNPQATPNGSYQMRADAQSGENVLERLSGETWVAVYGFDGAPVRDVDIHAANFLCARWEGAPFSANLMLAFHKPEGRIALFNRALSRGMPPDAETSVLESVDDLGQILLEDCGLNLTDQTVAAVWEKIKSTPTSR